MIMTTKALSYVLLVVDNLVDSMIYVMADT